MEVHERANTATMMQAMAHNLSTVDRDFDMLDRVLTKRSEYEFVRACAQVQTQVHKSYAAMLELYGESIARRAEDPAGHLHTYKVGSERTFIAAMQSSTASSRRDETK
jgi:hypothetical protein